MTRQGGAETTSQCVAIAESSSLSEAARRLTSVQLALRRRRAFLFMDIVMSISLASTRSRPPAYRNLRSVWTSSPLAGVRSPTPTSRPCTPAWRRWPRTWISRLCADRWSLRTALCVPHAGLSHSHGADDVTLLAKLATIRGRPWLRRLASWMAATLASRTWLARVLALGGRSRHWQ